MREKTHNTDNLWDTLLILINLFLFTIILMTGLLFYKNDINNFINKPKHSIETLEENSRKRSIQKMKERSESWDLIENGIHVKTGLNDDENLSLIIGACTSCHSSKLIIQNRATREGWKQMIEWMKETQGLTDLGKNEPKILDYLTKHYAPKEIGRRHQLNIEEVEWYVLNLEENDSE